VTIPLNTFSIVARCRRSGQLGVAIATAFPAVGAYCSYVEPGLGAVATQSWTNPYLAVDALAALRSGAGAGQALNGVLQGDAHRDLRQIGLVDASGATAVWTGPACTVWAGHREGDGFTVQGNMLADGATVEAMAATMAATCRLDLADRLIAALLAAQQAGGDKRGKQSSAVKIYGGEAYPLLDLRVDDDAEPIAELARIHALAKVQLMPFVASMPRRRGGAAGPLSDEATAMILTPPGQRPKGPRVKS